MSASPNPHEPPLITMSRAVIEAVAAAANALEAINTALATGAELGVATFGFHQLMACRSPLAGLIVEHGPAVALASNELAALGAVYTEQMEGA